MPKLVTPGVNDLLSQFPDLAAQLVGVDPSTVAVASSKKYLWRCDRGHEWMAAPGSRTINNTGCGYCAGLKVWPGENDLRTRFPEIAAELIAPAADSVLPTSSAVGLWRCSKGHEVKVAIRSRVESGGRCRECAKEDRRKASTRVRFKNASPKTSGHRYSDEEARAVMLARGFQPNVPYRSSRTPWHGVCLRCGRSSNVILSNVVNGGADPCVYCSRTVVDPLIAWAKLAGRGVEPSTPYPGSGKPWPGVCVNCGMPVKARMADAERQGACGYCCATPSKTDSAIVIGKALAVDFIPSIPYPGNNARWPGVCAKCGQPVTGYYNHMKQGTGVCGYCSGKRIDDAVLYGRCLAVGFKPTTPYVGKDAPWEGECLTCGNIVTPCYSQIRDGIGVCGYCSGRTPIVGETDLLTLRPDIAADCLDDPTTFTVASGKKARWQCRTCGHRWSATVAARTSSGTGCPQCHPGGYNSDLPGVFYVVASDEMVKGGISNLMRSRTRLRTHRDQGLHEVRHVLVFDDGRLAFEMEREWMAYVKTKRAHRVAKRRLPDGYTEALLHHDDLEDFIADLVGKWTLLADNSDQHRPT